MSSISIADLTRSIGLRNLSPAPAPDPNLAKVITAIQKAATQSNQVPSVIVNISAQAVAAAATANSPAKAEQATYTPSAAAGFTAAAKTPIPIMPGGYTLGNALAGSAGAFVGGAVGVACEATTSGLASAICVPAAIAAGEATSQEVNNLIAKVAQMAQQHPVVIAGPIQYIGPSFYEAGPGDGGRKDATGHGPVGHVTAGPVSNAGSIGGDGRGESGDGGGDD
ncbi:hypothetical protein [Chromobacterium violaceum]|uniref:hypothetical protein n=1 Tax=Chromobacterium violaceum TaxID=536 RepID=UPI00143D2AF7|nr:hypothetical protein [Chromobacterium violaceum]QIY80737.1 hypothetical protein FOB43_16835 [Chromobacterium violaceum]